MPRTNRRQTGPSKPKAKRHILAKFISLIIVVLIVLGAITYARPVPVLYPVNDIKPVGAASAKLSWPVSGEAAIGASDYGVLATHNKQVAKPTASVAKLVTVLSVLQKHPLSPGQPGPNITLTQADYNIYNKYYAEDGSIAAMKIGEKISQYQMMEAILLPSADNMADSLAIWAFGSLPAYDSYANHFVKSMGLNNTAIGSDASGYAPDTVSTPHDLVKLGIAALAQPVIAQIVSQRTAKIPVAGTIYNVNFLLGRDGISGIKTGSTDQAGGVYVFSTNYAIDANHKVTIVGAIQATKTLQKALDAAIPLLNSAKTNFKLATVIKRGQVVGQYDLPWAGSVNAVAASDIKTVTWLGQPPKPILALNSVYAPESAGSKVGSLSLAPASANNSTNVVLQKALASPPTTWRIIRHNF
ncbi:MAG: serine hydrolase [Candidatus Saccharimonadales bacterium]